MSQIIAFQGVMGVGKTTLIKAICKKLNVKERVSSPTFSLVNTYQGSGGPIYHFDFYRLKHFNEALDFGVDEYFESGNICLLEWAEKITPLSYPTAMILLPLQNKMILPESFH